MCNHPLINNVHTCRPIFLHNKPCTSDTLAIVIKASQVFSQNDRQHIFRTASKLSNTTKEEGHGQVAPNLLLVMCFACNHTRVWYGLWWICQPGIFITNFHMVHIPFYLQPSEFDLLEFFHWARTLSPQQRTHSWSRVFDCKAIILMLSVLHDLSCEVCHKHQRKHYIYMNEMYLSFAHTFLKIPTNST